MRDTLGALGERRIVEQLLRPRYESYSSAFGDDCAWLMTTGRSDGILVATTDPCPPPMAALLGFTDYYYYGWLLAAINLSDLAAAGASPVGLLTSLILPNSMRIDEFVRLLDGLDECCAEAGTRVVGGNLKEGDRVDLTATAIGICYDTEPLGRTGALAGDQLAVIGEFGSFWAGVFVVQRHLDVPKAVRDELLKNVLTPRPKVSVAQRLREARLLNACLDNSDGLYPSLRSLCDSSEVGLALDFDSIQFSDPVREVAGRLGTDPARFGLGWGDWQLVVTFPRDRRDRVRRICEESGVDVWDIGLVTDGSEIVLTYRNQSGPLLRLDSERFSPGSWFTGGVASYIATLLEAPLMES